MGSLGERRGEQGCVGLCEIWIGGGLKKDARRSEGLLLPFVCFLMPENDGVLVRFRMREREMPLDSGMKFV